MTEKIKVFIVEDQALARFTLENILLENEFQIIGTEANATKAHAQLMNLKPDIVLLDIHLAGPKTGLWLAENIRKMYPVPIVYLTAYGDEQTLSHVLDTEPNGYLMKPYNAPSLLTTIEIAIDSFYKQQAKNDTLEPVEPSIFIKVGNELIKLILSQINFLQSDGNYVKIYCTGKTYLIRRKLSEFIVELDDQRFTQVHRRYGVNMSKIDRLSTDKLTINNTTIPVSKTYQNILRQSIDNHTPNW
jgi:DNA-binding LytR/AlgR family response regulator